MPETRRFWWTTVAALLLVPVASFDGGVRAEGGVIYGTAADGDDSPSVYVVGSGEKVAYLGVQLEEETEHPEGGARVREIVENSPADKAGIVEGDIVIEFGGVRIRGPVGLTRQIHERSPGEKVAIRVLRDGRERTLDAELGDRAERAIEYAFPLAPLDVVIGDDVREKIERGLKQLEMPGVLGLAGCPEGESCGYSLRWSARPRLGVELVETTPELKRHLGSSDDTGVLVGKVLRGTPAEHAGVRVGDLLVRVGDVPVKDVSELREALSARDGETFKLRLIRDKKELDVDVTLPAAEEEAIAGPQARLLPAAPAPPAAISRDLRMAAPPPPPVRPAPRAPRAVEPQPPSLVPPPAPAPPPPRLDTV